MMKTIIVFSTFVAVCLRLGGCFGSPGLPEATKKEFTRFDDPSQVVITSQFVRILKELPADQIQEAKSRLRTRLQSEIPRIRRRAALTLQGLVDASGVAVMIRDMKQVTKQIDRGKIVVALRVMKDRRFVPVLIKATDDPSPYIRGIALGALGETKATNAYRAIVAHLDDREEDGECVPMPPAVLACCGLGELGDRRATPHLVKAVQLGFALLRVVVPITVPQVGTTRYYYRQGQFAAAKLGAILHR